MVYDNEYPAGYGWTVMYDSERFIEPIFFCPFCGQSLLEVTVINPKIETKQHDEVMGIIGKEVTSPWDLIVCDSIYSIEANGGKVSSFTVRKDIDQGETEQIVVEIRFYDVNKKVAKS